MFSKINPRILIIAYSILSSFLLVSYGNFNYVGWAFFGFSIVALILFCKKQIPKIDIFFSAVAILSASNFIFKTNGLVLFFSTITFLYATGWLVTKLPKDRFLQIFHLILPFVYSIINVFGTKDTIPQLNGKIFQNTLPKIVENKVSEEPNSETKASKSNEIIWGIITTFVVLMIILPLLSYANPQFGKYLFDIFNIQWIKDVWNWMLENIFSQIMIVRLCVIGFLYFFLPRLISSVSIQATQKTETKKDLPLSIPKIATIFTLFAFLAVQLQTTLQPELLTKSAGNIANETFFHLSVVCLIAFGLIYLNFKDKLSTKIWSLILLAQTTILGLLAFLSDYSYVINWGLTHKRLYGFSVIAIVVGLIGIFVYFTFRNSNKIITYFALLFSLVAVITNTINMDSLIYNNPPKETTGIEQNYVNYLSLDTNNLDQRYSKVAAKYNTFPKNIETAGACGEINWLHNYNSQIRYLNEKYKTTRIFDWSYSEFTNFQSIKNLKMVSPTVDDNIPFESELYKVLMKNCYSRIYQQDILRD